MDFELIRNQLAEAEELLQSFVRQLDEIGLDAEQRSAEVRQRVERVEAYMSASVALLQSEGSAPRGREPETEAITVAAATSKAKAKGKDPKAKRKKSKGSKQGRERAERERAEPKRTAADRRTPRDRGAAVDTPRGVEAVTLILQEQAGQGLTATQVADALQTRGWVDLKSADNLLNATRASLTRALRKSSQIERPESGIYVYRSAEPTSSSGDEPVADSPVSPTSEHGPPAPILETASWASPWTG